MPEVIGVTNLVGQLNEGNLLSYDMASREVIQMPKVDVTKFDEFKKLTQKLINMSSKNFQDQVRAI